MEVSIGLAVYNGEEFLAESLDSLLAQTYGDFELIISDNASTDGTRAICERYAAKDKRIRYVRRSENIGGEGNFNYVEGPRDRRILYVGVRRRRLGFDVHRGMSEGAQRESWCGNGVPQVRVPLRREES